MQIFKSASAAILGLSMLAPAVRAESDETPFTFGASYIIEFAPVNPQVNVELPKGISKIVGKSGDWIKVEYSTSQSQRSKLDPGSIEVKEKIHTAWFNTQYIVGLIKPDENSASK